MAKQKPFVIRTPFPTLEEVQKELGLSKRDIKRLTEIVNKIILRHDREPKARKKIKK